MKKLLTGFISVFAIIATIFTDFVLLEKYIYEDVYKEYPEFTNNTIWLFSIFVFVGLIITVVSFKKSSRYSFVKAGSIGFMLLAANQLLIGLLNIYNVQTLLSLLKINSITFVIALLYMSLVMFSGIYICFAIPGAVNIAGKDLGKMIVISFLVLSVFASFCPDVLSYPSFIIIVSFILFVAAFLVIGNGDENVETKASDDKTIVPFAIIEFMFMMAGAAFIKTVPYYTGAEKLISSNVVSFILPSLIAVAIFLIINSINSTKKQNLLLVLPLIMFAISAILSGIYCNNATVFAICYVVAIGSWFANIAFAFNYIFENKSYLQGFLISVCVILLPSVIGYIVAVLATQGFGYMNDIFSAIYLEPLRTNAEISKGLMPNADGEIETYKGIGEVIKLTYRRNLHIASPIVAYVCGGLSLLTSIIAGFLHKTKYGFVANKCEYNSSEN